MGHRVGFSGGHAAPAPLWSHQDSRDVLLWAATGDELVGLLKVVDGVKVHSEAYTSAQDHSGKALK